MSDVTNTPTILDADVLPSGTEDTSPEGWLTAESYVSWVQGKACVLLGDRPFAQPPAFPTPEDEEDIADAA